MAKIEARQMDVRCATSNIDHATHSVAHSHTKRPFARSPARSFGFMADRDRSSRVYVYVCFEKGVCAFILDRRDSFALTWAHSRCAYSVCCICVLGFSVMDIKWNTCNFFGMYFEMCDEERIAPTFNIFTLGASEPNERSHRSMNGLLFLCNILC